MIWEVIQLAGESPANALITLLVFVGAIVFALTVHEFSHAISARLLGDDTAKNAGRLTLNPLSHIDPAGMVLLLLVGFGWAKPTPFNPYRLSIGARLGTAAVAIAGPISNVALATLATIPLKLGILQFALIGFAPFRGELHDVWPYVFGWIIFINVILAVFNLLPVAPLDGFKVVSGLLPQQLAEPWNRLEKFGPLNPHGADPVRVHPAHRQPPHANHAPSGKSLFHHRARWTSLGLFCLNSSTADAIRGEAWTE